MRPSACLAALLFCLAWGAPLWGEEYRFDPEEIEKRPYHLGGFAELRPALDLLDRNSAQYRVRFFENGRRELEPEFNARLQLDAGLEHGIARLSGQGVLEYQDTPLKEEAGATLNEGYLSLKPSPSLTLAAGKKNLRWGKGYAWNPVAFFDRPKNPDDPELSLEGFWLASADYVRSFDGPLKTLSLTPVLLPAYEDLNSDYGRSGRVNIGGRLYLLIHDTDIDLLFVSQGSRGWRYGIDFSRNLATNIEIHGEFAWLRDVTRPLLGADGTVRNVTGDSYSWLLGLRYLTERDTTWIAEYFHNGSGYTAAEMDRFFSLADQGFATLRGGGSAQQLQRAAALNSSSYGRLNPMRNYLYGRVSQKEPFDILYFAPALTMIVNLDDNSLSLAPELLYTGIDNLELRLKGSVAAGAAHTEFGEKLNDARIELRIRYFF